MVWQWCDNGDTVGEVLVKYIAVSIKSFGMQLRKTYMVNISCISCIDSATHLRSKSVCLLYIIMFQFFLLITYVLYGCATVALLCNRVAGCVTGCPITHRDTTYVKHMRARLFGSCAISFDSRAADRFYDVKHG